MKTTALAVLLAAALVAPAAADRADDDLAAVKKAVAGGPPAQAVRPEAPQAEAAPARPSAEREAAPAARHSAGSEPKWFRVRVVEKGHKGGRVSINLPLGLVRAVGGDWPVHGCRRCEGKGMTLGEILRALDSGQSLVEIEDEDATVRVWVD